MTEPILVAIPCRVLTLKVELGAEAGASPLESLVLRAVAGGRQTVEDLGRLFSLPHRLMLDVVHGLWGKGFVAVDFSSNTLECTESAQSVLDDRDPTRNTTARVKPRKFLFDPVTATILPFERGKDRLPYGAIDMPLAQGISEGDLPQTDLLRAVREAVRNDRRRHGVHQQVLNVSFANPLLSPPQAVRWSTVEVVVRRDPATGRVTADPVEVPHGWGRRALQLFQARVGELVRNRPDSRFARYLVSHEQLEHLQPDGLRPLMLALEHEAKDLGSTDFNHLEGRQGRLHAAASRVLEQLQEAGRSRCSVQTVTAGPGVDWVVTDLIEQATHQIVLAVPRIAYGSLHALLPSLELAAKRGVLLVFLWGDNQSSKLEGKVATALFDLQARFSENVLLEQRSSRCSASVVVCDDRRAYVGSRSVLAPGSGSGILVEPAQGADEMPDCVSDLLSWARRIYPYWETARRIALLPAEFDRKQAAVTGTDRRDWPYRVTLPQLHEDWAADEVASRTAWSAAWGRVLRELVTAVEGVYAGDPVVRAVWDGMYVDLVQRSIAGASERLAITDDRTETAVCGDQLAQTLLDHRNNGVVVHLQHPTPQGDQHYSAKFLQLHKRLGAERTLRPSAARVRSVLSDHEVVIGSYRPLGNRPVNPAHGPGPAQLGLHVISTAFAADFAQELGVPDWFGIAAQGGAGALPLPGYLPPLPSLSSAPVDDDPWTVLADRLTAGAPVERLRRESAALLLSSEDGGPARQEWGRWLLNEAWERHAFMEAYLLAGHLGADGLMPVELAAVAVPIEHGPMGEQLYYSASALENAPPEHRTVALVGAVAEMLLRGSDAGALVYGALTDPRGGLCRGIPEAWLRLAEAAATCFDAMRAPLPLEDIDVWVLRQKRTADIRLQWSQLSSEVKDFERAEQHFNFLDGQRLHRALFRAGNLLAEVLAMARDDVTVDEQTAAAARLPRDVREARAKVDELAAAQHLAAVHWGNHHHYAQRISEFTAQARDLADRAADDAGSATVATMPALTEGQRDFARILNREWPNLLEETDAMGEPTCHPARALLGAFVSLPMIGRDDR